MAYTWDGLTYSEGEELLALIKEANTVEDLKLVLKDLLAMLPREFSY